MESPNFFSSGNYLLGGEDEPIVASVPQLHGKAGEERVGAISVAPVGDPGLAQGPIKGSSTRCIQHAGNASNLETISSSFHPSLCMVLFCFIRRGIIFRWTTLSNFQERSPHSLCYAPLSMHHGPGWPSGGKQRSKSRPSESIGEFTLVRSSMLSGRS